MRTAWHVSRMTSFPVGTFRITGPLCAETFTGGFQASKASTAELWYWLLAWINCWVESTVELRWFETSWRSIDGTVFAQQYYSYVRRKLGCRYLQNWVNFRIFTFVHCSTKTQHCYILCNRCIMQWKTPKQAEIYYRENQLEGNIALGDFWETRDTLWYHKWVSLVGKFRTRRTRGI